MLKKLEYAAIAPLYAKVDLKKIVKMKEQSNLMKAASFDKDNNYAAISERIFTKRLTIFLRSLLR
jgi:hypothetical protein